MNPALKDVTRPDREICITHVRRPGEAKQRCRPAHVAYVFRVPLSTAQDQKKVMALRAGCDQRVYSRRRGPVECWKCVNTTMVSGYKRGDRLREDEIALVIPTGWRLCNCLKFSCGVPRDAFYIAPAQFGTH